MSERIESLDTLKGLAILAVVIIHLRGSFLGKEIEASILDFVGLSITRFGVPVFFLISGFLLKKKFEQSNEKKYVTRYVKKLFYYYILASGLYLVLQISLILVELNTGISLPKDMNMANSFTDFMYNFFYTGYAVRMSLWFFPALIISAGLLYIAETRNRLNQLLIASGLLHLVGILTNTYQLFDFPLPPREALFFGLFYTGLGFKIGTVENSKIQKHKEKIILGLGLFLVLNIVERFFISPVTGVTSFFWQDYTFLTLPFALSIFLFGLSHPSFGASSRINTYGRYTLWAYILHQVTGGILTGLIILVSQFIGLPLLQNSVLNWVLVIGTYVLTFEAVIRYQNRSN